jgi:hypothetical protein
MTGTYRTVLLLTACGLALAAYKFDKPQTAAGPNYQASVTKSATLAHLNSLRFVDPDLAAFLARIVPQEPAGGRPGFLG